MKDYAVLIPTKGRPGSLTKLFKKCPTLNAPNTYIGIEPAQVPLYRDWWEQYGMNTTYVSIVNPVGMPGVAREQLRLATTNQYERFVLADDNCVFTDESLENLLKAHKIFDPECCMGGTHPTAESWHKDAIESGKKVRGMTIYKTISFIFWIVPNSLYRDYQYSQDCLLDDSHFALWLMTQKRFDKFYCVLEAPYTKSRFELGGTGTGNERVKKLARGIYRLAVDYPDFVDVHWVSTRMRWKTVMDKVREDSK